MAASGVLMLAVGLAAEEGVLRLLAEALAGVDASAWELQTVVDPLVRMGLLAICAFSYVAGAAVCAARTVCDRATSIALVARAKAGTARNAVPTPEQIRAVTSDGFPAMVWFLWANIIVFGLLGLLVAGIGMFGDSRSVVPAGLVLILYAAMCLVLAAWHTRRLRLAHARRRQVIAAHWNRSWEQSAWARARSLDAKDSPPLNRGRPGKSTTDAVASVARGRDNRVRVGNWIQGLAGTAGAAAFFLIIGVLVLTHPEAQLWRGGQLGPRGSYNDTADALFTAGMGIGGALAILSLGMALAGYFLDAAGQSNERALLIHCLADQDAARPPAALLRAHGEQRVRRSTQLLAACSGVGLVLGTAVLLMATVDNWDVFRGSRETMGGFAGLAAALTAAMLAALIGTFCWIAVTWERGRELSNRIIRRWPTLPAKRPDGDGHVADYRKGPALTP